MLIRAFGNQLDEHAREDVYSTAWVASLSSLGSRIEGMTEAELRKYVFAAVTTHAGKELRRRGRKPIDPLGDTEPASPAGQDAPAEAVLQREDQRVLRDVLASLPERRRRVLTLRYAVGLSPEEICEAVDGLSARAYRKELTRGIKEMAARLALVETGEWCSSLNGELEAFARGEASCAAEERARAHLAHCATCSRAVRQLAGSLHDLSLLPALGALATAAPAGASTAEGVAGLFERVKGSLGALSGRVTDVEGSIGAVVSSGGSRGGGSALIGGLAAKVGAAGAAGKVAIGCFGASAGLATCVATGVALPGAVGDLIPGKTSEERRLASTEGDAKRGSEPAPVATPTALDTLAQPATGEDTATSAAQANQDDELLGDRGFAGRLAAPEPVIAGQTVTPHEAQSSPEVAAATAEPRPIRAGGGSGPDRPRPADADQAAAQLATP